MIDPSNTIIKEVGIMGKRKEEIKALSVNEKKAALKGILIISSIDRIDQTESARQYIRNYKRAYGEGIGWETLVVHLNKRLEKIGENKGEEVQSKAGHVFVPTVKRTWLSLKNKIVSWTNKRKVYTQYRGGHKKDI